MNVLIETGVGERCWNVYDSYGEICVGCGCCSKDPRVRYEARLEVCKRYLEEKLHFDEWFEDPEMRKVQEKNVRKDIRSWRRQIAYYEKRLEAMGDGK